MNYYQKINNYKISPNNKRFFNFINFLVQLIKQFKNQI